MNEEIIPGTEAHFRWLQRQLKQHFWDQDLTYVSRSITAMGRDNVASVLNRLGREERRTTPPSIQEITAVEATLWDNWNATKGKRPKEGQPNHDKARYKVEVEIWNKPEGVAMWGGGNKTQNSIFGGTAIAMDRAALLTYLRDKREGKKIKLAWKDDPAFAQFANDMEALSDACPEALIGPLCWTSNKKAFVPGMLVMVHNVGDPKSMSITVTYPDGNHTLGRWTDKRTNQSQISGPNGEAAWQCRATNRADQIHWRNSKLS